MTVVALLATTLCLASGSSPAAAADTLPLRGHGWGHGRGMGQFGALGYTQNFGWNYQQILGHFYGGTGGGTSTMTVTSVRLLARDGIPLQVTSASPFVVGGVHIPAGMAVEVTIEAGVPRALLAAGCGSPPQAEFFPNDGVVWPENQNPGNDLSQMLTICGGPTYRGQLILLVGDGALRTINFLGLQDYLRGVVPRESPSSWPAEALKAQAVAARSYALAEGGEFGGRYPYAKTCDTTACQVYGGAGLNGLRLETANTDAAIAATDGQVRRFTNGVLARTEFSSSTGGYSAGGVFPAVIDQGDSVASNPNHLWNHTLSTSAIGSRYGVGTFTGIDVLGRNGFGDWGGRISTLRVRGTAGSVIVTGDQFRLDWGLKSTWFTVLPNALDWQLRNTSSAGPPDVIFPYGPIGTKTLMCDWNGDGIDTPAFIDSNVWAIRNSNTPGFPEIVFVFGLASWQPICGDWNGDGIDTVGAVADGNVWALRNSNTAGFPEIVFVYGVPQWQKLVGDWNNDGIDTPGAVADGNVWALRNSNTAGYPENVFVYGVPQWQKLVGDWNGDGVDTAGALAPGNVWALRDSNTAGFPEIVFTHGTSGARPMAGDWNGDNVDSPGMVVVTG